MNRHEKTAIEVCKERLSDISSLLDQIGQELDTRYKPLEEPGVDWADAGDLGRARENLLEVLEGICPLSRSDIENTLEELRG